MFTRRSASVLIFFCLPLFAQLLSAFGYSQVGRISGPAAQATGRLLPPLGTISAAQPSRGSEASLLPAALTTPPIFQLPPVYSLLSSPFQGGAFVLADVNGDGIPDVVAAGNVSSYD